MPKIQLDRSLGCGRSARLKRKAPSGLGAAVRMIERMLDPFETDRHRQYRRRRRERVRYEKDRSADRAVIVVVRRILRWSLRRRLSKRTVVRRSYRHTRIADRAAQIQMDMAKRNRDLQRKPY